MVVLLRDRLDSKLFDPFLPSEADIAGAEEWLRQVCFSFGHGFHLDTPPSEYVSPDGSVLPEDVATTLESSLNRAFEILGAERPYEVCMEAFQAMFLFQDEEKPT
jgi:hypothetical protein